ncbi:MAG: phosphodiester glycosidase family protein [Longimicrobiales bacterium]
MVIVVPGVEHVYAWLPRGPWAIHVLAIDHRICAPDLLVAHAGPPLTAAAGVSAIARDALAAMNADFFALPAGTPVGAQVSDDEIAIGPGRRPVFALADGGYWAGAASIRGVARHGMDSTDIAQVNRPREGDAGHPAVTGLTLFTHWWGRPTTVDSAAVILGVRVIDGGASTGRGVVAAKTRTGTVALGVGRVALQAAVGTRAGDWLNRRTVGDTIRWNSALVPASSTTLQFAARQAVGGFPVLLQNAHLVTDAGEPVAPTFGPVRHPRSAVGWNRATQQQYWVVVDGRQRPYSDGMTLAEVAALYQRLGATDAINLDGGGSTTLLIRNRIVNRTSDATGERAVGNALLLQSCPRT